MQQTPIVAANLQRQAAVDGSTYMAIALNFGSLLLLAALLAAAFLSLPKSGQTIWPTAGCPCLLRSSGLQTVTNQKHLDHF